MAALVHRQAFLAQAYLTQAAVAAVETILL
jgi:hypothetical protein